MASKQIDLLAAGIVDSSGNVLQAGTAELYESGTSTPVTGWADAALGSSLGSTITLDSRGSKLVFVDGTVDLKIIIKDSAGTTVSTFDGLDYSASESNIAAADPEFVIQNTDQEDTDCGRNNVIRFKGEQSGGEVSTLATIKACHDGSSDDEKGQLQIAVNDGSDGDSPTLALDIGSDLLATFSGAIGVTGAATLSSTLGVTGAATLSSTLAAGATTITGAATVSTTLGVGETTPLGTVHIKSADIGVISPNAEADEVVIEGTGNVGMSIYSTSSGTLYFGDAGDNNIGRILYEHTGNSFQFYTNDTLALTIASDQAATFAGNVNADAGLDVTGAITGTTTLGMTGAITGDTTLLIGTGTGTLSADADDISIKGAANAGLTIVAGASSTANIFLGDSTSTTGGRLTYDNSDDAFKIWTNSLEAIRITSTGSTGIGETVPLGKLHVKTADAGAASISANGDELVLENSGNAGITILGGASSTCNLFMGDASDTDIGGISYDNSSNSMIFTSNALEVMRADNSGSLTVGSSTAIGRLGVVTPDIEAGVNVKATSSSYTAAVINASTDTVAGSGFSFLTATSDEDGTPDIQFILRGDGELFADGASYNTPADYAEYMEADNGEALTVGSTVVNIDGKVRESTADDDTGDIFGVVRPGNGSSLVTNSASLKWSGKYVKNEYGGYELNEDGERTLSPSYDPETEYIPRSDRPEWNIIGFIGQVEITKGQPVNPRWIKLKEKSSTIDMYLVR